MYLNDGSGSYDNAIDITGDAHLTWTSYESICF